MARAREPIMKVNYDEIAGTFDARYTVESFEGVFSELCSLARQVGARAILEVGCGSGHWIARQLEEAQKHPDGSGQVVNVLAMAASYDPDPAQFFCIRLPVTFDTCEVIDERWSNWLRQDPVVAIGTQASNLRRLKALYIDCGEKDH